jgi:hypothetical protein
MRPACADLAWAGGIGAALDPAALTVLDRTVPSRPTAAAPTSSACTTTTATLMGPIGPGASTSKTARHSLHLVAMRADSPSTASHTTR